MIEAFRIGVQMTLDSADTQSTVASLARDFTSLNQQIAQSQSGLSAVHTGLIDLAGQQKSLQRDQGSVPTSGIWQVATGLPRNEPMVTLAPVAHSPEQSSAAGVAAAMAPAGIAATVDGFWPNRRSEAIVPDPAMAILPSLATLLSRGDPRSTALPDLAVLQKSLPMGGDEFSMRDPFDRADANHGLRPGDRQLLDDLSARIAGVGGIMTAHDFAGDRARLLSFPTTTRMNESTERDTAAPKYVGDPPQPGGWSGGISDVGTASTLALAVAGMSSTATETARLMATITGGFPPMVGLDQSYPRIAPPPVAETNIFRPERQAAGISDAVDSAPASDAGSASEAPPLVIQTAVHLDGQVIAQAVTQHIVDWMNGPLPGAGGFDPRRSYTPVES
jgi:hypothetical protein